MELFWKKKKEKKRGKYSKIDNSPLHLKTSNEPMCLASNDLWLPNMVSEYTNAKQTETAQRAMERKMLDLKLQDKIPCSEIRKEQR